jgi:hypothetical protein
MYRNEVLAALGFLMMSIGNMRAGFRAAMTSVPGHSFLIYPSSLFTFFSTK